MVQRFRNENGFATFIEIVLVTAVLALLAYFSLKSYLKKPELEKPVAQELSRQGIDMAKPFSTIDAAKTKADEAAKAAAAREKDIQNIEQ